MNGTKTTKQPQNGLLIGDLVKHLAQWAAVERDERTGNPSLSEGLTLLVDCLKRHRSRPVSELAELQLRRPDAQRRGTRKPMLPLPDRLDSLEWDQVTAILNNEEYRKSQLIDVAERRLGIPRSRLSRLKRADAIESIREALDHERSLAAIGRHARLAGERRSA